MATAKTGDKTTKKTAKEKKADAKDAVPADIAKQIKALFDGGKAADLALFGRMLADQPDLNRDAACQVAHAISTNRVSMEMDYYTAVDDLKERRRMRTGAGMIGTVEFNSACFYRYANIDLAQLQKNLQCDAELATTTVEAFLPQRRSRRSRRVSRTVWRLRIRPRWCLRSFGSLVSGRLPMRSSDQYQQRRMRTWSSNPSRRCETTGTGLSGSTATPASSLSAVSRPKTST